MGEVLKRSKGGKSLGYYLRWYEGGKRRVMASKQATYADAKRMLQAIEGRIARGLTGLLEPPHSAPCPTVAALAERFLSEYRRPRIRDLTRYRINARSALKRALPEIGGRAADELTPMDIAKLRDSLSAKHSPGSARATMVYLGAVFSFAVKEGIIPASPCRGVERPAQRVLLEYLSRQDADRLLRHAKAHAPEIYPMLSTALYTGLRKGELFGLRWCDLDLTTLRLDVMHSYRRLPKGGRARHLRLSSVLLPILAEWRKRCPATPEGLVFPVAGPKRARMGLDRDMLGLPELLAAAGCPSLLRPWHALRHTFASHFVMAGGNILALQKILGHADLKMTLVYAHLAPDFLEGEMERVRY